MSNKTSINWKRYLIFFAKVGVSILALMFVFKHIDFTKVSELLTQSNPLFISLALLLFLFSQWLSARRLNFFFKALGIPLKESFNIRLYLLGMYYNLFLPGGVGGDAYKIILLHQHSKVPRTQLFLALLLDRLAGLVAIGYLLLLMSLGIDVLYQYSIYFVWLIPLAYGLIKWLLGRFTPQFSTAYHPVMIYALMVQLSQILAIVCIVYALGDTNQWTSYAVLFLVSSIAAALPLTIGGAGAREAVFLYGASWLSLQQEIAVTASLLFYMITVFISFWGIIYSFNTPRFELNRQ